MRGPSHRLVIHDNLAVARHRPALVEICDIDGVSGMCFRSDIEARSSFTPPVKIDSVNTLDQASTNALKCHKSPQPGTYVGEIPPADCYYRFYEQFNMPNVMVRQTMSSTHPQPVQGTSTHSSDLIRVAELITVAARIVNKCARDTYEYTLYGGWSIGRTNSFMCDIFTPIYLLIGG